MLSKKNSHLTESDRNRRTTEACVRGSGLEYKLKKCCHLLDVQFLSAVR